jgi:hypothetical protein
MAAYPFRQFALEDIKPPRVPIRRTAGKAAANQVPALPRKTTRAAFPVFPWRRKHSG